MIKDLIKIVIIKFVNYKRIGTKFISEFSINIIHVYLVQKTTFTFIGIKLSIFDKTYFVIRYVLNKFQMIQINKSCH